MSVSLREVIEHSGYKVTGTEEDALWLLSKQAEFEELIEQAQAVVDAEEEKKQEEIERLYREVFPEENEDEKTE